MWGGEFIALNGATRIDSPKGGIEVVLTVTLIGIEITWPDQGSERVLRWDGKDHKYRQAIV
jgi:hypothetical protein